MMTIRQLARRFGLSRATLLYYDRIGLLHPSARSGAGYRLYDGEAEKRLGDICVYKNAGLSLDAVKRLLDGPQTCETDILITRMRDLDVEIDRLRTQQHAIAELIARSGGHAVSGLFDKAAWIEILGAAGLDEKQMNDWHRAFETNAPEAHYAFLKWLGINENEIAHLRHVARGATDAKPRSKEPSGHA